MAIIIGNSDYMGNPGGGWNAAGSVWGNTTDDTFNFETQAYASNTAFTFDGKGGNDTIDFTGYTAVTFNLARVYNDNLDGTANTVTVWGTSANDTFQWNGQSSVIANGAGGNDVLTAAIASAAVTIDANSTQFVSIESFTGSSYNDTFKWNGVGTLAFDGGSGNDTLKAEASTSTIFNFAQTSLTNIETVAHNGAENVTYIFGSTTSLPTIQGSAANDFLSFSAATAGVSVNVNDTKFTSIDQFIGSAKNDAFNWSGSGTQPNLDGGAGTDTLRLMGTGTVNANTAITSIEVFVGASGNDTFNFTGSTAASINGGLGGDVVNFNSAASGVDFNLAQLTYQSIQSSQTYTVFGGTSNDTFHWTGQSAVTLNGGADGNDVLTADYATAAVTLDANSAQFVGIEGFIGSNFSDTLKWNGIGAPSLDGGNGNDTLSFAAATAGVTVNVNDLKITNIESFLGSSLADKFNWAGAGSFTLNGGAGIDTLQLNATSATTYVLADAHLSLIDTIVGTAGYNDTVAWAGADTFSFDLGNGAGDALDISSSTAGRNINLAGSQFTNIEIVTGSNYADTLYGSSAADTLYGGNGADALWGGSDSLADSLSGGSGADTYYWSRGFGNDTIMDGGAWAVSTVDTLVLQDVALADLNIGSGSAAVGQNNVISRIDTANISFNIYKQGINSILTMDMANNNTSYRQVALTDSTFNLFVGNDAADAIITGTSAADLIYGSTTAANTLSGGTGGADTMVGGAANDTFVYSSLATFIGQGGNDVVTAASSTTGVYINLTDTALFSNVEYAIGSSLADGLRGTNSANSLSGGAGADFINGRSGNDTLLGGAGADTFYFDVEFGNDRILTETDKTQSAADVVRFDNANYADLTFGLSGNNAVIGYGASTGKTGELTIEGFADVNEVYGAANANAYRVNTFVTADKTFGLALGSSTTHTLVGSSLDDYIRANDGITFNDTIDGGLGVDTIYGSTGNDYVKFDVNDALVDGGAGNDTLAMSAAGTLDASVAGIFSNFEVYKGSSAADIIRGSSAGETILGEGGADHLWGSAGTDSIKGGAGADTYWYYSGDATDTIADDQNNIKSDVVFFADKNFADLTFTASGANLNIDLGAASGTGNDTLVLDNWLTYGANSVTVNNNRITTFMTMDKTFGLSIANDVATTLVGTSLSDYLRGGAANDVLTGGTSGDSLLGGGANDSLTYSINNAFYDGGADTDTLNAAAQTASLTIDLRTAATYANIEYVQGGSGADILRGSSKADTLVGGSGDDNLWGYAGNDSLVGGVGADTYWFGSGDGSDSIAYDSLYSRYDQVQFGALDTVTFSQLNFGAANQTDLVIGLGTDSLTLAGWINYSGSTAATVTNANLYRISTFATSDKTFGLAVANDTATSLVGSSFSDYMLGGTGNDTLKGGAGDSLFGGAGSDVLQITAAATILDGGADTDTLSAAALTSGVTIDLRETATYANIEYVLGSSLADILRGTTGVETLEGGKGNDHLWGNSGNDVLIGGVGADTYWFASGDGVDTITDAGTDSVRDAVAFFAADGSAVNFSALSFARSSASGTDDLTIAVNAAYGYTDQLVLANWGAQATTGRVGTFVTSDLTFGLAIGTSAADTLTGTSIGDYITGLDGADIIDGGLGADTIYAGNDADQITYKAGAALFDGGDGIDTLTAATATTAADIRITGNAKFANIEYFVGSSLADTLCGAANDETIKGGLGNDWLYGAAGNDYMDGGAGSDTFWFGNGDGADTIAAGTAVNLDYIGMWGSDGSNIQSTGVANGNLVITLTSGDSLTVTGWDTTTLGSKLNNFDFGSTGLWQLTAAGDGTTVGTWAKIR